MKNPLNWCRASMLGNDSVVWIELPGFGQQFLRFGSLSEHARLASLLHKVGYTMLVRQSHRLQVIAILRIQASSLRELSLGSCKVSTIEETGSSDVFICCFTNLTAAGVNNRLRLWLLRLHWL